MLKLFLVACALTTSAWAQMPVSSIDVANMREDIRGMSQRLNELSLRIEQLERENNDLRGRAGAQERSYVTMTQLNAAISDLNTTVKASVANARTDTLQQVSTQIEKLAKQTNAAIDSLAKGMATRSPVQTAFAEDYSKDGVSYTVQKGDTLAVIAKKTGGKQQDIINANKISDPSKIQVGQTLFIPSGK